MQLNIYGFDSQFPTQTAMTTVTINVLHNPNTPQITGTYDRTVPETLGFGEVVFNITAQDADIGVSTPFVKYLVFYCLALFFILEKRKKPEYLAFL